MLKELFLVTILGGFCGFSAFGEGTATVACYQVSGMTCKACSTTVKAAVKKLDGIQSIKVSVEDNAAEVEFDSTKTNTQKILSQIDSTGYKAQSKECKS